MTTAKARVRTTCGAQLMDWSQYAEYSPGDPAQSRRSSPSYPRYRYVLGGRLREPQALLEPAPRLPGTLLWVALNPSTATHLWSDPTVRRIQRFTLAAGYTCYEIVNLFAYRSRHPEELTATEDPVGPGNRVVVRMAVGMADRVVCCWGALPTAGIRDQRAAEIRWLYRLLTRAPHPKACCLGFTASGAPRHPLYLPSRAPMLAMTWDWVPEEWRRSA